MLQICLYSWNLVVGTAEVFNSLCDFQTHHCTKLEVEDYFRKLNATVRFEFPWN